MRAIKLLLSMVLAIPSIALANYDPNTTYQAGSVELPGVEGQASQDGGGVGQRNGRASYAIPIAVPPGHPSMTPTPTLAYGGHTRDGVWGTGWSLSVPRITRKTVGDGGQPTYDGTDVFVGLNGEDLVQTGPPAPDVDGDGISETTYREERDVSYLRYVELSGGGWRVDHPDGRKTLMGTDASTQIVRSRSGYDDWIAAWLPESTMDLSGNEIVYEWWTPDQVAQDVGADPSAAADSLSQRYLASIRYGCGPCAAASTYQEITVEYESRADDHGAPTVMDFSSQFLVETEFQASAIETRTVIGGTADAVSRVDLDYELDGVRLLLTDVTVSGGGESLPAMTFAYTDEDAPASMAEQLDVADRPGLDLEVGAQAVDVDGDGRIDLADLSRVGSMTYYYRNQADGSSSGFASGAALSQPGVAADSSETSVFDHTRNLQLDVVDLAASGTVGVVYKHNGVDGWHDTEILGDGVDQLKTITLPSLASRSNTVRADIDRDGRVDLVDTDGSTWIIYFDDGDGDFSTDIVSCTLSTPTGLSAGDAGVMLGDVNADGFLDVIEVNGSTVDVWPGRGRGCWGYSQYTDTVDVDGLADGRAEDGRGASYDTLTLVGSTRLDEENLRMADLDGDGRPELVEIDEASDEVEVWQYMADLPYPYSGAGWNNMGTTWDYFGLSSGHSCRIFDMDGDSIAEVLCQGTGTYQWTRVDLADRPQHLLLTADNGRGLGTTLSYTTSALVSATHEDAGHPWQRHVASSMVVLGSIHESDGLGRVLVREFDYADAYYRSGEDSDKYGFAGFGYVAETVVPYLEDDAGDLGTDPSDPGTVIRTWTDVGEEDWFLRGLTRCQETWDPTSFDAAVAAATRPGDEPFVCGELDGALHRVEYERSSRPHPRDDFSTVILDATSEFPLEGGSSPVEIRSEFTYDDFGNCTKEVHRGNTAATADEQVVRTDYVVDRARWVLRLPKRVRHGGAVGPMADPGVAALMSTYYLYDGRARWDVATLRPGDRGLLSETWTWTQSPLDGDYPDEADTTTVERFFYNANGLPHHAVDPDGVVTTYTYDADFDLFRTENTVDPSGLALTTTYTVDPTHGGYTEMTTPDGATTFAEYDGLGRMTALARPGDSLASPTMTRTYIDEITEASPRPHWIDDVEDDIDGLQTTSYFDGRGRVVCQVREGEGGLGDVLQHNEWTASGRLAHASLPYSTASSECSWAEISVTGGVGDRSLSENSEQTEYDALGRRTQLTHADGSYRTWAHGVLEVTEQDEEQTDASSNHHGNYRVFTYDGLGRTTSVTESHTYADADPGVHTTWYSHDALGNLETVEDAAGNLVYEAVYDTQGRVVLAIDADHGAVTTEYDATGRPLNTTDDRLEAVDYTYDAAGRVDTVTTSDGVVDFHYDAHYWGDGSCYNTGRLGWVDDLSGTTFLCHDERGRVVQADTSYDGGVTWWTQEWAFDSMDRVTSIVHADGTEIAYTYGDDGRLDALIALLDSGWTDLATAVTHHASGQVTGYTLGNGATVTLDHDERLRPASSVVTSGGSTYQDLSLTLDSVGNVTAVTDAVGHMSAAFDHDDLYRLVSASGDRYDYPDPEDPESGTYLAGEIAFEYDRIGNLTSKASADTASSLNIGAIAYRADRVHAIDEANGEVFGYDAAGNLILDDLYEYTYTPEGMLAEVYEIAAADPLVAFYYDYKLRRAVKSRDDGGSLDDVVYYLPDTAAEYRHADEAFSWHKHIRVGDHPVARIDGTDEVHYVATDHLGSPTLVMDDTGAIVEGWASFPFGAENPTPVERLGDTYIEPDDDATALTRRFQGREIDSETGLYDFGARVYRADLGRFMTPDTVVPDPGNSQSWNRYTFVRNNPLRYTDPTGHDENDAISDTFLTYSNTTAVSTSANAQLGAGTYGVALVTPTNGFKMTEDGISTKGPEDAYSSFSIEAPTPVTPFVSINRNLDGDVTVQLGLKGKEGLGDTKGSVGVRGSITIAGDSGNVLDMGADAFMSTKTGTGVPSVSIGNSQSIGVHTRLDEPNAMLNDAFMEPDHRDFVKLPFVEVYVAVPSTEQLKATFGASDEGFLERMHGTDSSDCYIILEDGTRMRPQDTQRW